jgi:hypothetical protein
MGRKYTAQSINSLVSRPEALWAAPDPHRGEHENLPGRLTREMGSAGT